MKIGLLAYHSAINFGATLQLYSTYCYLRNHGYNPVVINWIAADLDDYYEHTSTLEQREQQLKTRSQLWNETRLCRTSIDVAHVIEEEGIEAVVIGSDAVAQYHTWLERLAFPCRTIVGVNGTHSDCQFPNAFWADWTDFLSKPIPVAVISASSQDSVYRYFVGSTREAMRKRVMNYCYLSVRDEWTQKMMSHITHGECVPRVTPDPVFAFSQNAAQILPSKEELMERFGLPERYVLMSFINNSTVSQDWIDAFSKLCRNEGITPVMLPFAHRESFGVADIKIHLPLSPVDWYALIMYSEGYVGHNMHPIVVSLHNNVPFFSFDNYGTKRLNGLWPTDKSSKIKHILGRAGLLSQRVSCISKTFTAPSPESVFNQLRSIERQKMNSFATDYLAEYNQMMADVISAITK